jgi:hypothetical protein
MDKLQDLTVNAMTNSSFCQDQIDVGLRWSRAPQRIYRQWPERVDGQLAIIQHTMHIG